MTNDKELELLQKEAAALCQPLNVKAQVYAYTFFIRHKAEVLKEHYLYRCASGLEWLYNPDSYSDNIFTRADWGTEYNYVVILESVNEKEMESLAAQLLIVQGQIGLIYLQVTDNTL